MDLLTCKIGPTYFKYLTAASGSAMVSSIFAMVDVMMVGKYHGPIGTAALAIFNPLWTIIYSLGLLSGIGGSVLFASARGSNDEQTAQEYFTLTILYGLVLSALATVGIALFNEPLLRLFGADDVLLGLAKHYLKPILFAIPCCVFSNIISALLRNDGNPVLATKAVIFGGIFNAFGDYFCVFVLDMGIFGAGLATAIGQSISIFIMLLHFAGKKNTLRFVKVSKAARKLHKITVNGFSTAISDLAMGVIGVLFNRQIMKYLGADALAVYGILTQVTAIAQCLSYACGQAAQPIISQNYGAGKSLRIRECLEYGLYTSAVMGIVWAGTMLLAPNMFVNIFMAPTESVKAIAAGIIRAYGCSYLLLPFNIFVTYYFQAIMQARVSMIASMARGVFISGALIIMLPVLAGANSIWYSMLITEILVAAYGGYHLRKRPCYI